MRETKMILTQAKVTKGTVRYDHQGERGEVPINAVYVLRQHLPSPFPKHIELTLGVPETG